MQPTSANIATLRCHDVTGTHPMRIFFRYKKIKRMTKRGRRERERHEIQTTQGDWRDRVIVVFRFLSQPPLIENKMIVIIIMIF